jgi:hypothetical protein
MKKITVCFSSFALCVMMYSCSTSNVIRSNGSDMEVAASKPRMIQQVPQSETSTAMNEEIALNEAEAKIARDEFIQHYSDGIKELVASTNNKFAKRSLTRVTTQLDNVNVNKEKLSLFDKFKLKLFSKMLDRYTEKYYAGLETGDILAIISISLGGMALLFSFFAWFSWAGLAVSVPFGIGAIVTGIIALKKGTKPGLKFMPILGIIFGAVGAFFGLLFTMIWFFLILA